MKNLLLLLLLGLILYSFNVINKQSSSIGILELKAGFYMYKDTFKKEYTKNYLKNPREYNFIVFKPDYQQLHICYIKKVGSFYEIKTLNNIKYYISQKDIKEKFYFLEYFKRSLGVSIIKDKNNLIKSFNYSQLYCPLIISGDSMKIHKVCEGNEKILNCNNCKDDNNSFWIRWRKKDTIMLTVVNDL